MCRRRRRHTPFGRVFARSIDPPQQLSTLSRFENNEKRVLAWLGLSARARVIRSANDDDDDDV